MRASRRRRVLIGAAAAVPTALAVSPGSASASVRATAPPPSEPAADFCSTMLLTPQQLSAGEVSAVRCFSTLDESLRSIGVDPAAGAPAGATASGATEPVTNTMVLASHFDRVDGTGVAFSIGGYECNGGGISFPAGDPWNDRIRSTVPRGCSTVKHFSDANFLGTAETTSGAGQPVNLSGALAGRVSSMRYYA